mgnify:CR=1 FL=1
MIVVKEGQYAIEWTVNQAISDFAKENGGHIPVPTFNHVGYDELFSTINYGMYQFHLSFLHILL